MWPQGKGGVSCVEATWLGGRISALGRWVWCGRLCYGSKIEAQPRGEPRRGLVHGYVKYGTAVVIELTHDWDDLGLDKSWQRDEVEIKGEVDLPSVSIAPLNQLGALERLQR